MNWVWPGSCDNFVLCSSTILTTRTQNVCPYYKGGIRNAQPIISDVLITGILDALVSPFFTKVLSLGRFHPWKKFYPAHPFLRNIQDVKIFSYLCLGMILKGIYPPTKRVKANIEFHGLLSKSTVRTKGGLLLIISKYLAGHRMSNMLGNNNPEITFCSAMWQKIRVINHLMYWFPKTETEQSTNARSRACNLGNW